MQLTVAEAEELRIDDYVRTLILGRGGRGTAEERLEAAGVFAAESEPGVVADGWCRDVHGRLCWHEPAGEVVIRHGWPVYVPRVRVGARSRRRQRALAGP